MRNKIVKEINSWYWYDKMIFNNYYSTEDSLRDVSRKTGVNLSSIHRTIKKCNAKIQTIIGDDYKVAIKELFETL
tara:strand:+ start:670 stop:894 length:225 start_codon:yes stop_codon:yes gene_type:complete